MLTIGVVLAALLFAGVVDGGGLENHILKNTALYIFPHVDMSPVAEKMLCKIFKICKDPCYPKVCRNDCDPGDKKCSM